MENQINKPILIEDLGMHYATNKSKKKSRYGLFECPICKESYRTQINNVKNGNSSKCRSCSMTLCQTTHGRKNTRLYKIWADMKGRCLNSNHQSFKNYGLLGVIVCDSWIEYLNFEKWALSSGYKDNLTIDRIDAYGNYEPDNCRWADWGTQARNKRKLNSNSSGYVGVFWVKSVGKWCAKLSINYKSITLGYYRCRLEAAYIREQYIADNNLEHFRNFK